MNNIDKKEQPTTISSGRGNVENDAQTRDIAQIQDQFKKRLNELLHGRETAFREATAGGTYQWGPVAARNKELTLDELTELILRTTFQAKELVGSQELRRKLHHIEELSRSVSEIGLISTLGTYLGGHQYPNDTFAKAVNTVDSWYALPQKLTYQSFMQVMAQQLGKSLGLTEGDLIRQLDKFDAQGNPIKLIQGPEELTLGNGVELRLHGHTVRDQLPTQRTIRLDFVILEGHF